MAPSKYTWSDVTPKSWKGIWESQPKIRVGKIWSTNFSQISLITVKNKATPVKARLRIGVFRRSFGRFQLLFGLQKYLLSHLRVSSKKALQKKGSWVRNSAEQIFGCPLSIILSYASKNLPTNIPSWESTSPPLVNPQMHHPNIRGWLDLWWVRV